MRPEVLARRYALLTALRWFPIGLVAPMLVLLMQARGLDLAQVGRLVALYSLSAVLLELPTGGLADVIGRRPVIAGASLVTAAGSVALALAPSAGPMALAILALGAGRALSSGPLDAWYVDTVRAEDPQAEIRTGIGRAQAAESVALAVGAAISGLLPALGERAGLVSGEGSESLLIPLSVPYLACALMLVVHAIAVAALVTEAPHHEQHLGHREAGLPRATVAGTVRATVRLVTGTADLRRLVGYSIVAGVALASVELVSPAAFGALLGGPEQAGPAYGLLVGLGFGAAALGALLAPRAVRRLGAPHRAAVLIAAAAAPVVLLVAVPQLVVAAFGFLAFYLVFALNGPIRAGLLHDRIPATQRSTVLSAESLALQLGGGVASVGVGALVAATTNSAGYVVVAVALLFGALLLRGVSADPGLAGELGSAEAPEGCRAAPFSPAPPGPAHP